MTKYTPNKIPEIERIISIVASVSLAAYGIIGLLIDDIYVPGKRGPGSHLHGIAAYIMFAAIFCFIINFLSVIVDHYDERDNERYYKLINNVSGWLGLGLIFVALMYDVFNRD